MKLARCLPVLCVFSFGLVGANLAPAAERPIDFSRDIRPILSNTCYKCHGPDEKERQAGLRLDLQEAAHAKLESGVQAIVPSKSAESALYLRITSTDADQKMPPPESGKTLTPQQIDLLKRWIDEGATWRGHWSFQPLARPEPPPVKTPGFVRNAIDQFILARLEVEGLSPGLGPSPEADKTTLIRRVTFDLTGLPPALAEIDAFLADDSQEAYDKLVTRLLDSPRYGEHLARYWLDAARYGDTHGLHFDNERLLWPYRDWVIRAINGNMPFDQFTIEQLAGDLLPNPTVDQRIATGFNRCNVSTSEGGSINDEVLVRYAVDRVETTGTVWMGLTVGCAVCHDHKFDPVSQKEFYQLYAFFNQLEENAMDGNALAPPPVIKSPTAEQQAQQAEIGKKIAAVQQQIAAEVAKIEYVDPRPAPGAAPQPQEIVWIDDALPAGAKPSAESDGWKFVGAPEYPVLSGAKSHRRVSKGLSQHYFTNATNGLIVGEGDKLFCYVYLDPLELPKEIMVQFNDGSWEHRAYWGEDLIAFGTANTPGHVAMGPLPEAGQWVRLEVEAAKVGLAVGATINGWAFTQHDGTVLWDKAGIVSRLPQAGQSFESLADWEAVERAQTKSTLPAPVQEAIKTDAAARTEAHKKAIRDYFLEHAYGKTQPTFAPLHQQIADLNKQSADLDALVPTSMVSQEMAAPRDTFVLIRGAYDKKGDKVSAGVPAALSPLPAGAPVNRLGLAKWLVDPAHPLTARVIVNRYWQQYFGTGIVKTAEDFGSQGEWPSHPELLDWLATEFIRTGWNVKEMQRLIVTSATYRQASRVTPQLLERDPENRLLARGPRFRLDAEMMRDGALAASGLLAHATGGRAVRPYQPEGLWEAVGFLGSNTSVFKADAGDALYRRSLFTFWKRTAPPPSLLTFDAPSRETCTVRRARTNTPLQALVLMNDEQYVEAARRLAQRAMAEGGAAAQDRAAYAFRLVTARKPSAEELAVMIELYQSQLAQFQADTDAAAKLLAVGVSKRDETLPAAEHAAWTMVANLILNLDEAVTKN